MPIYEYECKDCGNIFEEMISSYNNSQNPACTKCNSNNTQKLFSPFNAIKSSTKSSSPCAMGGSCSGSQTCQLNGCCAQNF
jgi:putative FmdB family regulatory protein